MTKNCGAENRDGEPCSLSAGWGTDHTGEGRCKFHGGASSGGAREGSGAPEGNGNAITHGARSDPTNLYENLDDDEEAWVDSKVDAYLDDKGLERDTPDGDLVELAVMSLYQARSAHGVLFDEGLSRSSVKGTTQHGAITDTEEHYLNQVVSQHTTDFRMALKDAGALADPESQKADATQSLVDVLSE